MRTFNGFSATTTSAGRYVQSSTIFAGARRRASAETTFRYPGKFMFHAHQSEFAELGWMGFFDVSD